MTAVDGANDERVGHIASGTPFGYYLERDAEAAVREDAD